DPCGRDGARFLMWLLTYGRNEHGLSTHHIAPMRAQWRSVVRALPSFSERLRYELILRGMAASVSVRTAARRIARFRLNTWRARNRPDRRSRELATSKEFGVNLVGYFQSETGVGQSVRAAHAALKASSVTVSPCCIGDLSPSLKRESDIGP